MVNTRYLNNEITRKARLERELDMAKRDLEYNSFYHYIKHAWDKIEGVPFVDSWHIGCIADHLQHQLLGEPDLQRIIVNIQVRLSKSIICSVMYATWSWIHFPHYKILNFSHSDDLAGMFTFNSRQLIESEWYRYWRDKGNFDLTKGDTRKTAYSNTKLGYRMSFGTGGRTTGYGGDLNIIDDPNDLKDYNSPAKKQAVIDAYKVWKTRVTSEDTKWLLIQQRIPGGKDLTDYIQKNEPENWFKLVIPTEYTPKYTFISPIGKNDPRKKEGELVCPQRFSDYSDQKKDPFSWSAIYQQQPTVEGGNILKEHWLNYYIVEPEDFDIEFISADLALETDYNNADYTVFTHIGVKRGNFYITDIFRDQIDFPTQLIQFKIFCENHPKAQLKLIEDKASGKAFKQMMQQELDGVIGVELKNKTKEERLYTALPSILAKKIHIPDITHYNHQHKLWVNDFKTEYLTFPSGEHDDILDTTVQFINYYNQTFGQSEIVYVTATNTEQKEKIFQIEEDYKISKYDTMGSVRPIFTEDDNEQFNAPRASDFF